MTFIQKNISKLFFFLFLINFVFIILYLHNRLSFIIQSDDSAELILGKLLSESNSILSSEWKYSNELRLFNYVLFSPLLFKITNDWHVIRVIVNIIQYAFFLFTLYYFVDKLKIKKYFFLIALILFLPFSRAYYEMTVLRLFYFPHIMVVMINIISVLHFHNKQITSIKDKIYLVLYFIFSFYIGLSTNRFLIAIYFPLLLMLFILLIKNTFYYQFEEIVYYIKYNPIYYIVFSSTFFNLLGYLINRLVLKKIYSYYAFSVYFSDFEINRISKFISTAISTFGYKNGVSILKPNSICSYLALLLILLLVISIIYPFVAKNKKNDETMNVYEIFSLFTFFSWTLLFLLYCFTDMDLNSKYMITNLFLSIINIFLFAVNLKISFVYKWVLFSILFFALFIGSILEYINYLNVDFNSERIKITNLLIENEYKNGLSTFTNGPILTELSNGEIEMWYSYPYDVPNWRISHNDSNNFLQLKSHDITHPKGKTFIILTTEEYNQVIFKDKFLEENLIYSSDKLKIYGYESYNVLVKNLTD